MKRFAIALHVDDETHALFDDHATDRESSVDPGALLLLAMPPEGDLETRYDMTTGSTAELPKAWRVVERHFRVSGGTFFLGVRTRRGRPLADPPSNALFDGIAFYTHADPKRIDRYVVLESDGVMVHRSPFLDHANARRAEREIAKRTRRTLLVHLAWSVYWDTHM